METLTSASALAVASSHRAAAAGAALHKGAANTPARAKAMAEEFEAVFLGAMFNEMFAGIQGEGPLGGAGGGGVWRSFLADEYARSFAKAGGIGLGAQVYSTLLAVQEGGPR
jgi:Rod binding domain-containing protein